MSAPEVCGTCGQEITERPLGWVHTVDNTASCGAAELRIVPQSQMKDPDYCAHEWSAWKIGPYYPREERFCPDCGSMETQELTP